MMPAAAQSAAPSAAHRRSAALVAAGFLAAAFLSACGGSHPADQPAQNSGTAPAAARPNRLVIGLEQEPDKLNTSLNAMVYGPYINNAIYGFFVKYDEKMNLIPDVLTEIPSLENGGISPDGLTYTYHLRPGLKWHDGVPFTAADVLFSIDAIMNPAHEVESRIGYDMIKEKSAPDDLTVVLHLKEVYAPFTESIFFSDGIMPKHLLETTMGSPAFNSAPYHRAPVGLGPFKFKEWVTGSHVTIIANPDYWRGKPAIDEITFRFIPDTNSLLVALQAGEIDGYDNAGTDQIEQLKKLPSVTPVIVPQLMWEHVDFNCEDPILKDVRVRQAIQFAIDRNVISREVYADLWKPAQGDISPALPAWYNPKVAELVRQDLTEAARLLDEAGWKLGADNLRFKNGQKLSLSISTTAGRTQREQAEEVLQQQLRQVGIELTIQNHNATAFFAPYEQNGVLKRGKFQLAMYAWITSPDPNKKSLYHSSQIPPPEGQNHTRYRSPKLDALIDEGLRTLEYSKRKAIYDDIQILLATDVPMTPIVWRADIDPMSKRLLNYKGNPTQNGDTWNIWEWTLSP